MTIVVNSNLVTLEKMISMNLFKMTVIGKSEPKVTPE